MAHTLHIPEDWRMLTDCLRCAIHDHPPPDNIAHVNWAALLRQARAHSVECYLFPWLCRHLPAHFSARATVSSDSPQAAWRAIALEHLNATIIRQEQTSQILAAFANAGIEVLPLKGTLLSEILYEEPSQRQMVDIDLLVKRSDAARADTILTELGYTSTRAMSDSEYIYDLVYHHPAYLVFIELHWNVECRLSNAQAIPDIDKILTRATNAKLFEAPIKIFLVEDQLCHLVQHILHHRLALSLKSYIDIALLINAEGQNIIRETLDTAAVDWKTGAAVPFMLQLVASLFGLKEIPAEIMENSVAKETLQEAVTVISELPLASARDHEINLLQYREASAAGKVRVILNRIFMPRSFMQLNYPFAKNALLLPIAWMLRTITLIKSSGRKIVFSKSSAANLANAARRAEIIREITK